MKSLIMVTLFAMSAIACKKTSTSPSPGPAPPTNTKSYINFLTNTEWVGVDDGQRSQ